MGEEIAAEGFDKDNTNMNTNLKVYQNRHKFKFLIFNHIMLKLPFLLQIRTHPGLSEFVYTPLFSFNLSE
jgi:hypothetical protein